MRVRGGGVGLWLLLSGLHCGETGVVLLLLLLL